VTVPQHLELEDVIAWGLGPLDLLCVVAGAVVSWWLYLALPDAASPLRVAFVTPPALAGAALGTLRVGGLAVRQWLVIAFAYVLRPRILVTGGLS